MDFSIRELESLSGIKAHTIRIWEQRYRFLKPTRTSTNIRRYSSDELKTILTVALLNKWGYRISRIDSMGEAERQAAVMKLPQSEARDESVVNQLLGYMVDIETLDFESLVNAQIQLRGLENALGEIIFPFLDKVGLLWQTNRIIPVQEHIISNIIRQKIITAIDGLPTSPKQSPLFLLFLPEGEHHEMGLLYVHYLLRRQQIPVIYLGTNVPMRDIEYLAAVKSPDRLYLHLTSFPRKSNLVSYLSSLRELVPGTTVLISGASAEEHKHKLPDGVQFLPSVESLVSYVNSI